MTNGSIMNGNFNRYYGQEVNGNGNLNHSNMKLGSGPPGGPEDGSVDDKFEVPLPFGYHLDLDFLRVCDGEEKEKHDETIRKLKELKKARRKQRKELEALMGIKQEQRDREKKSLDLPGRSRQSINIKTPPRTLNLGSQPPDIINSSELVREALRESMLSFQETLDQYKEQDLSGFDLISTSTPVDHKKVNSKYNTFPRIHNLGSPSDDIPAGKLIRQFSNSSISSISTSSSALPYNTPLTPEAYLASLPSSVMPKQDEMETNSIGSISSDMSTTTLRNIREQMARSLVKLKEYEKQVEAIPMLQVKLSVLKEEKRLLMLKLKAREAKLRKDRGEMYESDGYLDNQLFDEDMDTDDEDLDSRVAKMSNSLNRKYLMMASSQNRRARSESPYAKCTTVHPEDFISFQRKRSTSCGFNSDSSDVSPSGARKYYTQDSPEFAARSGKFSRNPNNDETKNSVQIQLKDQGVNTDQVAEVKPDPPAPKPVFKVFTKEKSSNTDPPPKSPPPPRKVNHGTNTLKIRSIPKGTGTDVKMADLLSKEEVESKLQDAIFRTEEEIMSCPLLQKAMQKVEEEALKGEEPPKEFLDTACQVGDENLRPFVIDIGVMCSIGPDESRQNRKSVADSWCQITPPQVSKSNASCGPTGVERMYMMRTIGVGDCKIIEDPKDPTKHRSIGICTEKWVDVIKASKQTDTEDFAFKDTESPRVADLQFDPPIELPLERRQRLSSLTSPCLRKSMSPSVSRRESVNSPSVSRKSSSTQSSSTTQTSKIERKHKDTMTLAEMKTPTKDAKVGDKISTRSVGTSAMILPLTKSHLPPGSPLTTPESEKPPVNLNLCDKCDKDIHSVAAGIISGPPSSSQIIAPPSPDTPWVSKIPRPCPPLENPEVSKLKSATSTGNLSVSNRSKSPASGLPVMQRSKSNLEHSNVLQRSKSNLEGSSSKFSLLPSMSRTPPPVRRNMGTPPPHPNTPPVGSKRAPSPLARSPAPSMSSSYTAGDKKSLIPKFSPGLQRKSTDSPGGGTKTLNSPTTDNKSMIPRVVTPPALRKMFPNKSETDKSSAGGVRDRNVVRKQTYNRGQAGVSNPDLDKIEEHPAGETSRMKVVNEDSGEETETIDDTDGPKKSSSFPLPGSALFAPIEDNGSKSEPSKEMKGALKVLKDSLGRTGKPTTQISNAINIIQQEWFKTSSTKQSVPRVVEDYLDFFEDMSKELLEQVVNLADVNGNTALHYSVSHGNFDVVSILLDSKVGNANILNKAGYTCTMLVSLALISSDTHRAVVKRLFSTADLNVRASQHGQTALMLAVSHGRLDMVDLLLEAGADVNIRDEDGSTALMCAAEHGHMEIVKLLMRHPDININATDNDGLSALSVAMEAGHRDIGVVLYANMSFSRGASPHSSMRMKKGVSRESIATPTGQLSTASNIASPVPPTPSPRSRRNSSNM